MPRRHDDSSLRRRGPSRDPKQRILIVCEGEKTEPLYFGKLQHHLRNPRLHVKAIGPAGVPLSVVRAAIEERARADKDAQRERDENIRWDQVWAVFDVDDHPNIGSACELASKSGISVAISNPCFELWALLHVIDQRAHIERTAVRAKLKEHFPRYDKELEFDKLHLGYDGAVRRAQTLDADAVRLEEPNRNPTTDVYKLTEIIRRA